MQAHRVSVGDVVACRRVIDEKPIRGEVDIAHPFRSSGRTNTSWQHLPISPPSETSIPAPKKLPYPSLF